MSHITGGGITGNLTRMFPTNLAAEIKLNELPDNKLFNWLQISSNLTKLQMLETFNCGIGYVVIVSSSDVEATLEILSKHGVNNYEIGSVINKIMDDVQYK